MSVTSAKYALDCKYSVQLPWESPSGIPYWFYGKVELFTNMALIVTLRVVKI